MRPGCKAALDQPACSADKDDVMHEANLLLRRRDDEHYDVLDGIRHICIRQEETDTASDQEQRCEAGSLLSISLINAFLRTLLPYNKRKRADSPGSQVIILSVLIRVPMCRGLNT